MRVHSILLCRSGKRGEVHVCGDVLVAGSLIRVGAQGVLTKRCDRTAMASGELFLASVSVVDRDENATIYAGCDARHRLLCDQRDLDSFAGFRMDAVAVEETQLLG